MDRDEAIAFVREKAESETNVRHRISVEGVTGRLAHHLDEEEDVWGLTGLFHDPDQDQTHEDPERHAFQAAWLRGPASRSES